MTVLLQDGYKVMKSLVQGDGVSVQTLPRGAEAPAPAASPTGK